MDGFSVFNPWIHPIIFVFQDVCFGCIESKYFMYHAPYSVTYQFDWSNLITQSP